MRETPRGSTRCADLCGAVEVVHDREQHKRVHNHGLIRHVCVSRVRCGAAITNDRLQRGRKEDRRDGSSFCFWPLLSLTLCCDTRRCQHARYMTSRRSERSVLPRQHAIAHVWIGSGAQAAGKARARTGAASAHRRPGCPDHEKEALGGAIACRVYAKEQ